MQVRNGRRPHGRLRGQQPAALSKDCRFFVQPTRTTSWTRFVLVGGLFLSSSLNVAAQLRATQFFGTDLPPYTVILTRDDGFDQDASNGTNQTMAVARSLSRQGLPGSFFIVGCHFYNPAEPRLPDPRSGVCAGSGDRPLSLLDQLSDLGFVPWNHSFSHVVLSLMDAGQIVSDVRANQVLLDPYQKDLGLHLFRGPGLECLRRESDVMNADSCLARLKGPISADVGGAFILDDGTFAGGDWWFYGSNKSAEEAGRYYVRDIAARAPAHGVVVLLHTRTEVMNGADGSRQFPRNLLQYILGHLDSRFTFAPLDAIPGLIGRFRTGKPHRVSDEFGANDGDGPVQYADINGDGRADACKARGAQVWCMVNETIRSAAPQPGEPSAKVNRFMPSTSWFEAAGTDWTTMYNHKFWLVDWNKDGRSDLVVPVPDGFQILYSNGAGFSRPEHWTVQLTPGGWTSALLDTVRFGDINGDGYPDVIGLAPEGIIGANNNGSSFDPPSIRTSVFSAARGWLSPQYASTLQFRDVDGDGRYDICIRGASDTYVGLSNGKTFERVESWTRMFNDRQGWNSTAQYQTLSLVKIAGKIGLAGGVSSGIVFQQANVENARFPLYRYINNEDYSTLSNWRPERYSSGLGFADFDGSGNESPALTRADGLDIALIKVARTL
jgi:peptidoglycan/xylan/chitin deacetylase (PgdA/CDA1 family)